MAIKVASLCEDFGQALEWACPYVSPGQTTWNRIKDGVDCSGLFVAAYKKHGGSIYHGSNTIARRHVTDLKALTAAKQLFVGAVVFKWLNDGGEPEKYKADGLGDFVHIGLCVSVSPLKIIHASSAAGCVTCDTKVGKWKYYARLNGVDYGSAADDQTEDKQEEVEQMLGGTLITNVTINIREGKGTGYAKLGKIPAGTTINFDGNADEGWVQIAYGNVIGYICTRQNYVTVLTSYSEPSDEPAVKEDAQDDTIAAEGDLYRDELETRVSDLEEGSAAQTEINEALVSILRTLCQRQGVEMPVIPHMISAPIDTFEADE